MDTYPFAGEIKMTKVIKDGQEVIEWEQVDLTYHADGNVGIGTPPQVASAPLVMGEPVERIRFIMSNQEPEAHVFAHPATEWARIDKDMNVMHLDMELCAKGPHNAYTALAMAIWNKAIETEREACAELAMQGTNEPVQTKTLEILRKERERIAEAIRARGDK